MKKEVTIVERNRMRALYQEGHTISRVAEITGRGQATVWRHVNDIVRTKKRHYTRNPVILGRKNCAHCGRWRHIMDFPKRGSCYSCLKAEWEERRQSPEWKENRREYNRMYYSARQRAMGRAVVPRYKARKGLKNDKQERLPIDPLRAHIQSWMQTYVAQAEHDWDTGKLALGQVTGLPDKTVDRLLHENKQVNVNTADRIAVATGTHLRILYPDLF